LNTFDLKGQIWYLIAEEDFYLHEYAPIPMNKNNLPQFSRKTKYIFFSLIKLSMDKNYLKKMNGTSFG
jgi:hypothetical protein